MGFIYMLTSPSGKSYIGQTIRPIEERLRRHQFPSSKCVAILRAIQKYGWDNFEKHWYEVPDEDLNDHEELMVEVLGTLSPDGYNLKEGGGNGKPSEEVRKKISDAHNGKTLSDEHKQKISNATTGEKNPNFGKTPSEETRAKISESKKGENNPMFGKPRTEETKQKLSIANTGKIHTDETKQKMSGSHTGKIISEETRKKMSDSRKGEKNHFYGRNHTYETRQKISTIQIGRVHSEESKQKMSEARFGEKNHKSKTVYQYDNNILIQSFASTEEAARSINTTGGSNIRKCARGELTSAYGFKWSYTKL
ncbi:GIY-YIG catalytic domain-containing endonuclease [Acanthocystis turfacea Chlorella virus NE-JV-2]|nr:GIY-YIG catalytic domain-containing endonuclease [Acanthocystis turfacea Chlorella virus NE-JV-2]